MDSSAKRTNRILRPLVAVLTAAVLAVGWHVPADAQVLTTYAVGYADGDETGLGLLGAQIRPGGNGLQPIGSLEGYVLGYPDGLGGETTVFSVTPGVGAYYLTDGGALSARAGYQFVSDEEPGASFFSGGESGVTGTLQAQYWGSIPMVEGLANYNFSSSFLWSQAQAFLPVVQLNPGSIDIGAEYVFQGDLDDDDTRAQLIGPLARWATGAGSWIFLSGGLKNNLGPADNTWYGRATAVVEF